MSHKRMMMKDVTSKNMFVSMSKGAQLLYFHLNMETDDDGVAEGQLVMNMIRSRRSDMIELIENDYVTVLEEKGWIVYINDFHAFNSLGKYLVYPSVYRNALIDKIPGIENVLFEPKNNILSRRKGARSKEKKEEIKRSDDNSFKVIKPKYDEVEEEYFDEVPFK